MNIEKDSSGHTSIPSLREAHNNLHISLGDKAFQQYNGLLRQLFSQKLSKVRFDEEARKLLCSSEQIHMHNVFLFALTDQSQPLRAKLYLSPDLADGAQAEHKLKYAVQERYVPDEELVRMRVLVTAFQNDLDGADDNVTKLIVLAVKIYLKNILTAVISKSTGYKLRENMFAHGIGFPVANPWLRNYGCAAAEDEVEGAHVRDSLERSQQKTAFAYACASHARHVPSRSSISLLHLYETLLQDPALINNHTIYSINLERILAKLDTLHV